VKRLLTILFLLLGNFIYSQNLIQTYVDRCTGAVNVFAVPMNGSTVVAFYNRSKTFTSNDFQNGNLQAWLEETYLWWTSLNPCSTNQTQQTTVQTTVQQTATQAATAATQAVATPPPTTPTVNVSPPPTSSPTPASATPEVNTPVVETSSTNTNAPTTNTGSNNSSNEPPVSTGETNQQTETSTGGTQSTETSTEQTSTETSESQTETQQTESTSSDSGDADTQTSETEDTSTSQSENESDSESTSEVSEEETTEESSEESSEEESTEEESSEEESESEESEDEESSEEESEEENEEESEEESDELSSEEEEEEDKKKKKKTFAPPIISANLSSMQNIDGTFNQTMTIGASRSSLLGTETYAVNGMIWDNLKQFMLNASYSKVHINKEGRVDRVFSASIGGARMFTTTMGNNSLSWTFLGKKGAVKGVALTNSLISLEFNVVQGQIDQDAVLWSPAVTGFYTKSFNFDRFNVSPMLAVSSPFLTYDIFDRTEIWNKEIMLIVGSNFDYQLTKQFKVNLGINTIHNTNPDVPLTWNFTIGSRFSF
jgi:hypothetical protein